MADDKDRDQADEAEEAEQAVPDLDVTEEGGDAVKGGVPTVIDG